MSSPTPSLQQFSIITLPTHRDCPISYKLTPLNDTSVDSASPPILIAFINGLILPQTSWTTVINLLQTHFSSSSTRSSVFPQISILTYDRYGQGQSRLSTPDWTPQHHSPLSAVTELKTLLRALLTQHYSPPSPQPKLIFISHSIGVPLTRLYDIHHPHEVSGHIFIDSNIANSDVVSIYPDPDSSTFSPSILPNDSAESDLRTLRDRTAKMFHPSLPNPEGLDRSSFSSLLPSSNTPPLSTGPDGLASWLTVIGHDADAFADEGLKLNGTPKGLNLRFMQPAWEAYNEGLLELVTPERRKGVVIAEGAGHFVPRDNPNCVAEEVIDVVRKVVDGK